MTISRDRGNIYFECDGKRCANIFETEESGFPAAHELLKEAGWKTTNEGGVWKHICDDCQEMEHRDVDDTIRRLG